MGARNKRGQKGYLGDQHRKFLVVVDDTPESSRAIRYASRRALLQLESTRTLSVEEVDGAGKVLRAAGLTYVASAAMAVMQVIYLVMRSRN